MKRPYLNQFERYMLKDCPKTSTAETIKFRYAWACFIKQASIFFNPLFKLLK